MKTNNIEKLNIALFMIIVAAFFTLVILPEDYRAAEIEHLRERPELTLENILYNFAYDYEAFLSDNIAHRSLMLSLARFLGDSQGIVHASSYGFIERTERYLLFEDRIMEVFHRNPYVEALYARFINTLAELAHNGVRVFSLIVPTPAEFLPEQYRHLSDSQRDAIGHINSLLSDNIITIDVYSVLAAHLDEYIFFRTDHHWTALGAYYAYLAFCYAAGLEPVTLGYYYMYYVDGFLGFLYNERPTPSLRENADRIYYFILRDPYFTTSRALIDRTATTYAPLFIQGDWDYFDVITSVQNGRTAVIVKDSFANCFIPFLAPHYERIIVIDPRHFEEPFSIVEELSLYADVDLLILNYVFSTTFRDIVYMLNNIL